ncbi:MAG: hypothetical protein C4527_01375 [Candidatus Omnitrophota bacterium]|jgi:hypothetical protein|nr:MAG: hypothetical protein C4527_01375 [Candidatus Omnitrophota bacterium]
MGIKRKTFDCVQMKNDIQTQLRKEHEGMTDEEIRMKLLQDIEQSNTPFARALREKQRREILVS